MGAKLRFGADNIPGKEVDFVRELITGIWDILCVSAMSSSGRSLEDSVNVQLPIDMLGHEDDMGRAAGGR